MLKIFRKYTKVIIWIVVVSFVLWGGYSISAMKKEGRFAGEVFGKIVTFQEFNRFYRATQIFMPSKEPVKDPDLLRNYTWQNIVYSREAQREGLKVTDEEVRGEISNILNQQGLINPTPEQYKVWLTRALQMSPREFEEGLREFIRIQKLLQGKIPAPAVPEAGKPVDKKAEAEAFAKQKEVFMKWTDELNKNSGFKDYLAVQQGSTEPSEPPQS
ncbi:MAG TPA: SurA N-terminal domain-containing protein [Candidatus Omnitrophota bacterium]|nr:SurA N-terminal domain-containing protein [Candidatus Omnitrophota bacterium]HPS37635.1 SurA N-terminal domain-containing protein [Candidatus Omnitrophota bacterium]